MLFEYLKWAGQRQNFGRWGNGSDPLRPLDVLRWNPANSNSSGQLRRSLFVPNRNHRFVETSTRPARLEH